MTRKQTIIALLAAAFLVYLLTVAYVAATHPKEVLEMGQGR